MGHRGLACTLATLGGYAISRITAERFEAAIDGFAAGALLVMLVGSMIPEATEKAKDIGWSRRRPRLRGSRGTVWDLIRPLPIARR